MQVEVSTVIDRPVATVWDFYAVHHVENHPRWDPTLQLDLPAGEPIGVGTIINRRANRLGNVTEGTMEVIEFEPERAMRVETWDGPMQINGWVLFDPVDDERTRLTLGGEFPSLDDSMEATIAPMMQNSASTIKALIESET